MQSVFRSGSRCVSRFRTARVFSSACSAGCGRRFGCGLLLGAGAVLAGSAGVAIATKPEGESHSWFTLVGPLFRTVVPPEAAHRLAVLALTLPRTLRSLLLCVDDAEDDAVLRSTVWDTSFPNPLGMAAGFDKNGEAIEGVLDLGFAFTEIGSVTPEPQDGNAKPRVFRLVEDRAVINRYGFNSEGHSKVRQRLKKLPKLNGWLGVNLGKNKLSADGEFDFVKGVKTLGKFADYIVVNVSSPNTPGLRSMQGRAQLLSLMRRVKAEHNKLPSSPRTMRSVPLLIKIAPDLSEQDKVDIAHVASAVGVDGIIVSNTTVRRPESLSSPDKKEVGGLSGKPLFESSTQCLRDMWRLTGGKIPLIGVGGVSNGREAYEKIRAGASLVQLYSAFVYGGPPLARQIKQELAACLKADGFSSVEAAIGADAPI